MNATHMSSSALAWSGSLIRVLIVFNLIYVAVLLMSLVISLTPTSALWIGVVMGFPEAFRESIGLGVRAILLVALVAAGVVDRVLRLLLAIVMTVRQGDPFVAGNARRLEAIAWWVLAGECLRLVLGAIEIVMAPMLPELDLGLHFSVAPWLAVLLFFVLARVFAHGTRMRGDLEGTV